MSRKRLRKARFPSEKASGCLTSVLNYHHVVRWIGPGPTLKRRTAWEIGYDEALFWIAGDYAGA